MNSPKRLIIGISGASGAIYGIRLLELLRGVPEIEPHMDLFDLDVGIVRRWQDARHD